MEHNNTLKLVGHRDGVVVRDCIGKLRWFCEHDAYPYYDALVDDYRDKPDVITREVLYRANSAMRARSSVRAWQVFLEKPMPELAALPMGVDLVDAPPQQYEEARKRLAACYRILTATPGITDTAASKVLYLKRPELVAISDSYVRHILGVNQRTTYAEQGLAVADAVREVGRANAPLLSWLQSELAGSKPEPIRLSKARIVDILLWMQAKAGFLYGELFDAGCIKFGEFKLKSGIMSPVYCDFRGLVSKPALLAEIGRALAERAKQIGCDRIAGIPYAGLPLGVAASIAGDIPMIYPRKEAKDYGTKKLIEGEFQQGDRVLVIDDIITDGASKIEAIAPLEEAGLEVTDVLIILDREQGGDKILAKAGYKLHSLGKLSEVLDALVASGKVEPEMRAKVAEFIAANQFA